MRNALILQTLPRFLRPRFPRQNKCAGPNGGAEVWTDHPEPNIGVLDNKWVSSTVRKALILRHLTFAFSTGCQNHANFFSAFGRHVRGGKKCPAIFREFCGFNRPTRDTQHRSYRHPRAHERVRGYERLFLTSLPLYLFFFLLWGYKGEKPSQSLSVSLTLSGIKEFNAKPVHLSIVAVLVFLDLRVRAQMAS